MTANRSASGVAPHPDTTLEAVIQAYSARTFNWRGIFAVHTWIATKEKNAKEYKVYQVIGWRLRHNLSPVVYESDIPDRFWFNQKPHILLDIRGVAAEKLIPEIKKAAMSYPYPNEYQYWPGPNSNTFIAYIARSVPALKLTLPSDAVGKDYLPWKQIINPAASGTGYQFSMKGLFGITIAVQEGFELNILGLVYGISPMTRTLKLPGFGDIKW
ncbi:MAG: DUF3750 domain-containing protein [Gammaproteobacteria bacterium]